MTIPLELQFDPVNSLFNLRAMQGKTENTGHVIHRPKCPSQWEKKTHTKPQHHEFLENWLFTKEWEAKYYQIQRGIHTKRYI